jgi:hypothetical protein
MSAVAVAGVEMITVEIGAMPVLIRTESAELADMLRQRYGGYLNQAAAPVFEFDVEAVPPERMSDTEDAVVRTESGRWVIERGDFYAEWDPRTRRGRIRQSVNPYSIDSALRILHSLLLANEGGLLVHAASAIRNGRAFLFAGVSGAGKTTISRLAPPDATLLTDEISYVRANRGQGPDARGQTPGARRQGPGAAEQPRPDTNYACIRAGPWRSSACGLAPGPLLRIRYPLRRRTSRAGRKCPRPHRGAVPAFPRPRESHRRRPGRRSRQGPAGQHPVFRARRGAGGGRVPLSLRIRREGAREAADIFPR